MSFNQLPTSFDFSGLLAAAHHAGFRTMDESGSHSSPPSSESSGSTGSTHSTSSRETYQTAPGSTAPQEAGLFSTSAGAIGSHMLDISHLFQEFTKFFSAYLAQHSFPNNSTAQLSNANVSPSYPVPVWPASVHDTHERCSLPQFTFDFRPFNSSPSPHVSTAGTLDSVFHSHPHLASQPAPQHAQVDSLSSIPLHSSAPLSFPSQPAQSHWEADPLSIRSHSPLPPPSLVSQHPPRSAQPAHSQGVNIPSLNTGPSLEHIEFLRSIGIPLPRPGDVPPLQPILSSNAPFPGSNGTLSTRLDIPDISFQHPSNIPLPLPHSNQVPLFLPNPDSALHSQSNPFGIAMEPALPQPDFYHDHFPENLTGEDQEDDGNEADTESFPMFSTRRRANKRKYTGDALVSLDDIRQEKEKPPKRTRGGPRMPSRRASEFPNRRPAYRSRLLDQVRQELASLVGMDKGRTLADVCQALSNNELNVFETLWNANAIHHLHANCCDIDNFYIDLVNPPHSAWNESASRVFTIHFIKKFKLSTSNDMMNCVREAFFGRIKGLRSDLRKEQAGKEAVALCHQATRRWLRKQTLFYGRLMATSHPKLQRYRVIIVGLGVAGMSTDESDQETTNMGHINARTFRVRVPIWRAPSLTPLLRWIDKMYLLLRRMSKTLRGALPRIRIAPDADTEATFRAQFYATMGSMPLRRVRFVNDLPKCAYDSTWFGIFLGDGFDLRYTNEEWDLTIDLELFAFFEKYFSLNVFGDRAL